MPKREGVSAAEAYERAGDSRPDCGCHGEPMVWKKSARYTAGGTWVCAARNRYQATHFADGTRRPMRGGKPHPAR